VTGLLSPAHPSAEVLCGRLRSIRVYPQARCQLVRMFASKVGDTLWQRKEAVMESALWAIVVYSYVVGVLAVVGFGVVRMFGGFHPHGH
jgi:hypothetical protein